MFMFIGPIIILFLLLLSVIVFYLNGEGCCVLGPRLPLSRTLERLTIGLRTTSRVGGIKPSPKVESVVILRYMPTRSVTTVTRFSKNKITFVLQNRVFFVLIRGPF